MNPHLAAARKAFLTQIPSGRHKRRNTVFLGLLVTGFMLFVFLLSQFAVASQQANRRKRVIDDKHSYPHCPIKIMEVETETTKTKVALGEPFLSDDDWIKDLTVRIKNTSNKVVTHVGIKIHFDRPANQAGQPVAVWDLWYGVSPFYFKPEEPIPPPMVQLIQPGETQSITLSEVEYVAMTSFLRDISFPASIERIHISVSTIAFADGTAWRGRMYRRDPGGPGGLERNGRAPRQRQREKSHCFFFQRFSPFIQPRLANPRKAVLGSAESKQFVAVATDSSRTRTVRLCAHCQFPMPRPARFLSL